MAKWGGEIDHGEHEMSKTIHADLFIHSKGAVLIVRCLCGECHYYGFTLADLEYAIPPLPCGRDYDLNVAITDARWSPQKQEALAM
jgi:hypothetical protein